MSSLFHSCSRYINELVYGRVHVFLTFYSYYDLFKLSMHQQHEISANYNMVIDNLLYSYFVITKNTACM